MVSVENELLISLHRFDQLVRNSLVEEPQFLQIDVQGFEYEVLEGIGNCLNSTLCIELEAHFKPLYQEQKLFYELKTYLEDKGFYLRHLYPHGPFEGEVVEINAFFVRKKEMLMDNQLKQIEMWEDICSIPRAFSFYDLQKD